MIHATRLNPAGAGCCSYYEFVLRRKLQKIKPSPMLPIDGQSIKSWTTSFFYGEKAQKIPIVIKSGRYGRAAHGRTWSWFMTTHSQNYEFVWPIDWKNMVRTARYGWLMQRNELRVFLIWKGVKNQGRDHSPTRSVWIKTTSLFDEKRRKQKFKVNYEIVWCELRDFLTAITRLFDSEKQDFA